MGLNVFIKHMIIFCIHGFLHTQLCSMVYCMEDIGVSDIKCELYNLKVSIYHSYGLDWCDTLQT